MNGRPLDILLGPAAAAHIASHGWRGEDVRLLLGASGGPKWLILGHLDRVLFSDFLGGEGRGPLEAVGSSVGSWRHACLAQADPRAALDRFEEIYLNWTYSAKPDAQEVSAASAAMLRHILAEHGAQRIVQHPWLHTHIVTARGRGLAGASGGPALVAGMGLAALANGLSRQLLHTAFQRVVFNSHGAPPLSLRGFDTRRVPLNTQTVPRALHASGSIPFVLEGERDIPGAPPGQYWDGGIIDYHFSLEDFSPQGLLLYPHFRADTTPGWFDKFLPWRRRKPRRSDWLVMLSPSAEFARSLPLGKIPDRSDFTHMDSQTRIEYWRSCVLRSRELAEDFQRQLQADDPLQNTRILGA